MLQHLKHIYNLTFKAHLSACLSEKIKYECIVYNIGIFLNFSVIFSSNSRLLSVVRRM